VLHPRVDVALYDQRPVTSFDPTTLPDDLPRPVDDGAAAHVTGLVPPPIALPSTRGGTMRVDRAPDGAEMLIVYAYPRTGQPGVAPPDGWDEIPGARGCTPESCGCRDHAAELAAHGAAVVGLSTQATAISDADGLGHARRQRRHAMPPLARARGEDALRVGHGEAPLVQRLPHHDAREVDLAQGHEPFQIIQ